MFFLPTGKNTFCKPGIFLVIPSHHTPPSSVNATFVKTVSLKMDFMAIGLLLSDVPGATPKKPFSGLMARYFIVFYDCTILNFL